MTQKEQERLERSRSKTPAGTGKTAAAPRKPKKTSGQESSDQSADTVTPKPSVQTSLRKKVLKKKVAGSDSIDRSLMSIGEAPASVVKKPEPVVKEPEPVFYGPKSQMESYKEFIANFKQKEEEERNAQIPEQILSTSVTLNNEFKRVHREQTANPAVVEHIQDQEIQIGQELLDVLSGNQVEKIAGNASAAEREFGDLYFDRSLLNTTASKPNFPPETIRKLKAFKDRMYEIEQHALSFSKAQQSAEKNCEKLLDTLNATVQGAQRTVDELLQMSPKTKADHEVVKSLIASNIELIDNVAADVAPLIAAIERSDPKLAEISLEIAAKLNETINASNEKDEIMTDGASPSKVAGAAAEIQDERNENFEVVAEQLAEISRTAEMIQQQYANGYVSQDPQVRRYMGLDDVNEYIDLSNEDLDFEGGFITAAEFLSSTQAAKAKAEQSKLNFEILLTNINEDENLDDIQQEFYTAWNDSFEFTKFMNDQLAKRYEISQDPEERESIQSQLEQVQELQTFLEQSLEEVKEAALAIAEQSTQDDLIDLE